VGTESHLIKILTKFGQKEMADILGVTQQEVSKKLTSENGIKLNQLAKIFDAAGVKLAGRGDVVLQKEKHQALLVLAKEALEAEAPKDE
jgi:predicted transcriptional regulator